MQPASSRKAFALRPRKPSIQKALPSGVHAADAAALTPGPAATGKGAFLLANVACLDSSIGSFNESALTILIEKPKVNGPRAAAAHDFYDVFRYMDAKNETKPFAAIAWDHALASDVVAAQGPGGGTGKVRNGSTSILRFVVSVTPKGPTLDGVGRFWHTCSPDSSAGMMFDPYKLGASIVSLPGAKAR